MDIFLVISRRLKQLGLGQKDLAKAAQVTESYISQLLTRKKSPPAPERTDIYDKIGKFLKLPAGELARLADLQRHEELKRTLTDTPATLFPQVRELVLNKCEPEKAKQAWNRYLEISPSGKGANQVRTILDHMENGH